MDASLLIMVGLVVGLGALAVYLHGWQGLGDALVGTGRLFRTVGVQLLLGFTLAGLIQVVVPADIVGRWMGAGSGLRGILVGTMAGTVTPGGPYVNFPIIASLYKSGAGVGPLAAYLTAWSILGLTRTLAYEIPFMGYSFTVARLAVGLLFPIAAGLLVPPLFTLLSRVLHWG